MEEFQEADVLWPDATHHHHACHRHLHRDATQPHAAARPEHLKLQSAPVRIPAAMTPEAQARSYDDRDDDDGTVVRTASGGAEPRIGIVPPHVLAARRCADERRVASSVCVGQGRTLKGRDLRAVRNAVLHMTGFLSSSDKY